MEPDMTNSENSQVMADDQTKGSHTPGPWQAIRDGKRELYEIGVKREIVGFRLVAQVHFGFHEPTESQQHANARLIAAAPELLAALKAMDTALCDGFDTQAARMAGRKALIAARAAIAKAEGRS